MTDSDISGVAKQMSDLQVEIDTLTAQIEPVVQRIKELKKNKVELRKQLTPVMQEQNVQKVSTPAVQICLKPNACKIKPFNRDTVQLALQEYYRTKNVELDVADAMAFIEEYRKLHKDVFSAITLRKSKDYVPLQVQQVQPVRLVQSTKAATQQQQVQPFAI